MYKSNNFKNPKFWLGRAALVCVIFFAIGLISFMMNALSVTIVIGLVITCIFLILITQVSELTIDESRIAIESKNVYECPRNCIPGEQLELLLCLRHLEK